MLSLKTKRDTIKTFCRSLSVVCALSVVNFADDAEAFSFKSGGSTGPQDFADIVEPLLPAVVNISTTTEVTRGRWGGGENQNFNFPPGSPLEDFFKHFMQEQGKKPRKSTSLGSGFVISQEGKNAFIVTCNHVIADADEIQVTFNDDTELVATVVGRDQRTDLALLKVVTDKKLEIVEWGDSKEARAGEWVIAIGNPFGLSSTVTVGIISTIARDISSRSRGVNVADFIEGYIQTDAPINMGNSGGPMFRRDGKVLGVNTAIYSPNGGNIGIAFSIPSHLAQEVITQLKKYGRTRRGWIGVQIQLVTDEIAESLGLPKTYGAMIVNVTKEGPGAKAGLKSGDIILEFNGAEVKESRFLPRIVGKTEVGTKGNIVVWRKGKKVSLDINVGEFEEAQKKGLLSPQGMAKDKPSEVQRSEAVLGMKLSQITPAIIEKLNLNENAKGLVIVDLENGSQAEAKGLQPGDTISQVQIGKEKENAESVVQIKKFIDKAKKTGKKSVLFLVRRKGIQLYIALKIDQQK